MDHIHERVDMFPVRWSWLGTGPFFNWGSVRAVIFHSMEQDGHFGFRTYGLHRTGDIVYLPAPAHVRAAWDAGEPWRPFVDWMIETYPAETEPLQRSLLGGAG